MEKKDYREMLRNLRDSGCPATMTQKEAAEWLNMSLSTLKRRIKSGKIKKTDGKIVIGTVANYLCG